MDQESHYDRVTQSFSNGNPIWPENDVWHMYTRKKIEAFLFKHHYAVEDAKNIINAGSSGESYGFDESNMLHIDLAKERIENKPKYLVANLEQLPIEEAFAECIICVGSVLNYTDPLRVIKELHRVNKQDGYLFIEFECSNTLELVFTRKFNQSATIVKTFYRGNEEIIWYFSERWIKSILFSFGYEVISEDRWHIFSPLIYRITQNSSFSSKFIFLDRLLNRLPFTRQCSSNIFLLCRKTNQ